jgi:hypothetical protein
MATRGEQFRAEEQRKHKKAPAKATKLAKKKTHKKGDDTRTKDGSAGKKAAYADENQAAAGQPSRRSTRKSANRAKPDSNLTRREGAQKTSADNRYRKDAAKRTRVRGSTAQGRPSSK